MHLPARVAASIGSLAMILGGSFSAVQAEPLNSDVVGHLYVNDKTAGVNTVAGFNRHPDGSLTPIAGSPFVAGGAGTGQGIGSQGALQSSNDGRYLLVADAGSSQISVLRIRHDGSLRQVEDSPVSSGGSTPVTIAVHDDLVFVGNSGAISNYTGFRLDEGGHLRHLDDSTFSLPSGSMPGDVFFDGDGSHLVGTRIGTGVGAATLPSKIDSFTVSDDGHLTAAPGSPFAAQGAGPFGSEFRPTNADQLFVSNAHDGAGKGSISAYDVTANGILDPIAGSYERVATLLSLGQDPRWRKALVAAVCAKPDDHVLDVATGTGTVARTLERKYGCRVIGLDQSADMLAAGSMDGRPLVRARGERLPFADESFHHVTFTYLLRYVEGSRRHAT